MKRDDIIRFTQESGLKDLLGLKIWWPGDERMDAIERLVALVAAEKDAEIKRLRAQVSKWQTLAQVHAPSMEFHAALTEDRKG